MLIRKNKKIILFGLGAFAIILVGVFLLVSSRVKNSAVSISVTPQPSTTPSPGTPGNPGDTAKSALSSPSPSSKVIPTPTPIPQSGIGVSIDTVTPQPDGNLLIANTVTGTNFGSCIFSLTDPSNKTTQYDTAVNYDGKVSFCTRPAISGVTQTGSWSIKLSVTSGSLSGSDNQGFTK